MNRFGQLLSGTHSHRLGNDCAHRYTPISGMKDNPGVNPGARSWTPMMLATDDRTRLLHRRPDKYTVPNRQPSGGVAA